MPCSSVWPLSPSTETWSDGSLRHHRQGLSQAFLPWPTRGSMTASITGAGTANPLSTIGRAAGPMYASLREGEVGLFQFAAAPPLALEPTASPHAVFRNREHGDQCSSPPAWDRNAEPVRTLKTERTEKAKFEFRRSRQHPAIIPLAKIPSGMQFSRLFLRSEVGALVHKLRLSKKNSLRRHRNKSFEYEQIY